MEAAWVVYMRKIRNTRLPIPPAYLKTGVIYEWMAVFMLETLKLSKTLKSSRDFKFETVNYRFYTWR